MVNYVSRVCVCVLVCLSVSEADNDCRSTLCFKLWSRNININLNLFDDKDPLPIEEYIRAHDYPVQTHEITTDDGYVLSYHRIPYGKDPPDPSVTRRLVLLQHGLLGASSVWVLSPEALG